MTVSVEWHWPDPSTTTLAKGSGRPAGKQLIVHRVRFIGTSNKNVRSAKNLPPNQKICNFLSVFSFQLGKTNNLNRFELPSRKHLDSACGRMKILVDIQSTRGGERKKALTKEVFLCEVLGT